MTFFTFSSISDSQNKKLGRSFVATPISLLPFLQVHSSTFKKRIRKPLCPISLADQTPSDPNHAIKEGNYAFEKLGPLQYCIGSCKTREGYCTEIKIPIKGYFQGSKNETPVEAGPMVSVKTVVAGPEFRQNCCSGHHPQFFALNLFCRIISPITAIANTVMGIIPNSGTNFVPTILMSQIPALLVNGSYGM